MPKQRLEKGNLPPIFLRFSASLLSEGLSAFRKSFLITVVRMVSEGFEFNRMNLCRLPLPPSETVASIAAFRFGHHSKLCAAVAARGAAGHKLSRKLIQSA